MARRVFVVGAGVGGLTAGALLAKRGHSVHVLEKSSRLGGRTASVKFRNHVLDNGFHIMPFYKKSAIFGVLQEIGIASRLKLAKVDDIAFHSKTGFHRYPRGVADLLRLSLIPLGSRIRLLRILLPMAFVPLGRTEAWDEKPLTEITQKLDPDTNAFFEAICMLAFADAPERISLGEFARTIIRANPFRGGTSEFAYPASGGYDSISRVLADYILERSGTVETDTPVSRILVRDSRVAGILTGDGRRIDADCVVVSYPAYAALGQLFDDGVIDPGFAERIRRLDKKTAVVEVHFALSSRIDSRQVVFPVGDRTVAKGIFFISNIAPSVSPPGEHLVIAGTPVAPAVADDPSRIREIAGRMRREISSIYPAFGPSLIWERPMAWKLVESVAKEPGLVWKSKMPHQIPGIGGLFFVGDSTVSYGIGTDSAAHSSVLCCPKIESFLEGGP